MYSEESNQTNLNTKALLIASLTPVSGGTRFINYLVDYFSTLILYYAVVILMVMASVFATKFLEIEMPWLEEESVVLTVFLLLIWALVFFSYYVVCEFVFGKTLGKVVTRTIVLGEEGKRITLKQAFIRTLMRCVPFEAFSFLGDRGWHDTVSNTIVVKDTDLLRTLIEEQKQRTI